MKREDIIRLALEALDYEADKSNDAQAWLDIRQALREMLEQQEHIIDCPRCGHCCPAESIAAAERERIIELNAPEIEKINKHFKTLEDALAAERERCAQICDSIAANAVLGTANECARAIRGQ